MEFDAYFRFLLSLIFVLALIGLLAWLARRFGLGTGFVRRNTNGKRLHVTDTLPIDGRRKLVLVRRDDVEHLVILGPTSEMIVETGIPAREPAPAGVTAPPRKGPSGPAGEPRTKIAAGRKKRS